MPYAALRSIEPFGKLRRPDSFLGTSFATQGIGHDFELLIGRLSDIQQQPLAAAHQAVPAAVAPQPILAHLVSQTAGRIHCFVQ